MYRDHRNRTQNYYCQSINGFVIVETLREYASSSSSSASTSCSASSSSSVHGEGSLVISRGKSDRWNANPDSVMTLAFQDGYCAPAETSCTLRGGAEGGGGNGRGSRGMASGGSVDSTNDVTGGQHLGSGMGSSSSSGGGVVRRSVKRSTYKHVPHREKPAHLVARRNARERRRVQAVNSAFVRLRRHIPYGNKNKRLSKVKTLRIAIDYISHLQKMIDDFDCSKQDLICVYRRPPHPQNQTPATSSLLDYEDNASTTTPPRPTKWIHQLQHYAM